MSTDNDKQAVEVQDVDNSVDLPVPDELETLKGRASLMGISFHPSVGVAALRKKIEAALADETAEVEEEDEAPVVAGEVEETVAEYRHRKRQEANRLVRVRITCMNPAKRELDGEIFTIGNGIVGTFRKFVPFNVEDGWHVPHIILEQIQERQCQIFVPVKDARGNVTRAGKLIREFAVEILPELTHEELAALAQRQAMANSI